MKITFKPLQESHFPLLLKWLEARHVKKWYDEDVAYTMDLIREKYMPRISSSPQAIENGEAISEGNRHCEKAKPTKQPQDSWDCHMDQRYIRDDDLLARDKALKIQCFIIHIDETPIGYIQIYNASIPGLPDNLGAIDMFLGEKEYLRKGIGSAALKLFLETYAFLHYRYIFIDPEFRNESAVTAYEKAGFVIWKRMDSQFWMIAHKQIVRLSIPDMISLETSFKEHFLRSDRLWLFGSRADLARKGGDIDLYVETYAETIDDAADMRGKFICELKNKIGEQKIDVVLNILHHPHPLLIHKIALEEGVRII